jgi:hypothetical protein
LKNSRGPGFTLAEVVLGLGLVALAFFALLSVCTLGTRFNQQNLVYIKAVQVADTELSRTIVGILYDVPAGAKAAYWGSPVVGPNKPYPSSPLRTGVSTVGADDLHYAIYATTLAGVGGVSPDNVVSRLDAYVWWKDQGHGSKLTSCTRLMVYGEEL